MLADTIYFSKIKNEYLASIIDALIYSSFKNTSTWIGTGQQNYLLSEFKNKKRNYIGVKFDSSFNKYECHILNSYILKTKKEEKQELSLPELIYIIKTEAKNLK